MQRLQDLKTTFCCVSFAVWIGYHIIKFDCFLFWHIKGFNVFALFQEIERNSADSFSISILYSHSYSVLNMAEFQNTT